MMNKMSLRMKLFILITLVVAVTFGIVTVIVSQRSVGMAKEDAFALADEMSAKYSYEIKSELQSARVTSESLMTVFKTLIERGEADRDTLNAILQNSLRQKTYIISFCVAFEPNKLDGKDAEYAGQYPLYGESGRYAPYWSLRNGEIDVEPLESFDGDVWYAGARDTGGEYITDPFFYEVQGTPVLMTSLVFPIIIDGEFIGIVSSDMPLDSLQEMVSHVNTSGLNEYTEIYSNSGIVVAHPDDSYFNASIYAASAYNMLVAEPAKANRALEIVKAYLDRNEGAATYENDTAFYENLTAYAGDPGKVKLNLSLLSGELAQELLQLDEDRRRVAGEAMAAVAEGRAYTVTEGGYYKVYTPVHFSDATNPWSVAVSVPIAEVQQKSNELRNYVLLISAAGIALVALLLYIVTRNLTKPILDLADSAKQVGEGNLNIDVPQAENSNEVHVLSTAFRTMVEQIIDLVNKLTQNSKELEVKNENLEELNVMLASARDQAEASNRAKSEFLSNMSHEMRTPLNAIVGMTAIGQKTKDSEKKEEAFGKIEEASAHLLSLINDVLDMSKMEANKLELSSVKFNFSKMLREAVGLFKTQMEEKAQTLHMTIGEDVPEAFIGDDMRLSQVIINLLANATKFTGHKGEIGLHVFAKEKKNGMCTLQFQISDTGIGISEEQQKKLFQMFEQADNSTSRSFGGTGLGLALSKRLVGLMGGEIWVESALNEGSTFFFTVTLEQSGEGFAKGSGEKEPGVVGKEAEKGETQADFTGKRILLAEDIEINREIVLAMLEPTNLTIDCAENGQVAYDMFAVNPGAYDAILMDIQMPVMDGIESAKRIKAIDQNIPIIALTANVFTDDVEKYLASGFADHIGKPLDYDLTIELLEKYLIG